MSRTKLKFKKRHKLTLAETMQSERRIRANLDIGTRLAFADESKRQEYLRGLLIGLEAEIGQK